MEYLLQQKIAFSYDNYSLSQMGFDPAQYLELEPIYKTNLIY